MAGRETLDRLATRRFIHIPGPNPVFITGGPGTWDENFVECCNVLKDGETYYLYYHGCPRDTEKWPRSNYRLGVASAPHPLGPWTRHDGNPIIDHREVVTHVIVQDGQSLMLSGIIQQEKFDDIRKVPILGDLPLIGPLFRTVEKGVGNRELVVFITPRVMETIEEVDEQMADPKETLEEIESSLNPDSKK